MKDMKTEELKKLYEDLGAELRRREMEEEEIKKAKLAAEKYTRYEEVMNAYDNFEELRSKFVEDYGHFTFGTRAIMTLSDFLKDF